MDRLTMIETNNFNTIQAAKQDPNYEEDLLNK